MILISRGLKVKRTGLGASYEKVTSRIPDVGNNERPLRLSKIVTVGFVNIDTINQTVRIAAPSG